MSKEQGGPPGGTDFADFEGDLELDSPGKAEAPATATPPPSEVGAGAGPATTGQPTRTPPGTGRPGVRVPRASTPIPTPSAWERLALPLLALVLLGIGCAIGYRVHCGFKVSEKVREFSRLAQNLQPALPRDSADVGEDQIRAAVLKFASEADVEATHIRPSIEPLDATTLQKLPRPARIAIGMASQLPNHRLPYSVVGFEALLVARHGWAEKRFSASRYTWVDKRGPDAPPGGPASSIGKAFESQMKRRLERALGGEGMPGRKQRDW